MRQLSKANPTLWSLKWFHGNIYIEQYNNIEEINNYLNMYYIILVYNNAEQVDWSITHLAQTRCLLGAVTGIKPSTANTNFILAKVPLEFPEYILSFSSQT